MTSPMPQPMSYAAGQRNSGLSIASLICGIGALVTAWIPCLNVVLTPLAALAALILGIIGWVQASKDPSQKPLLAIIGVALGVLAFIAIPISYMFFGRAIMEAGGQALRTELVNRYTLQADAIEQQARDAGVSDEVIEPARAEFDAVLDQIPSDLMQMEQTERDLRAALEQFRSALGLSPQDSDPPDDGG